MFLEILGYFQGIFQYFGYFLEILDILGLLHIFQKIQPSEYFSGFWVFFRVLPEKRRNRVPRFSLFFRLWLLDLRITSFFVALIQNRSRIPVEQNRAMQRSKPTKIKAHIFKVFLNLLISDTKLGPLHHQYYPPKAGQPQKL